MNLVNWMWQRIDYNMCGFSVRCRSDSCPSFHTNKISLCDQNWKSHFSFHRSTDASFGHKTTPDENTRSQFIATFQNDGTFRNNVHTDCGTIFVCFAQIGRHVCPSIEFACLTVGLATERVLKGLGVAQPLFVMETTSTTVQYPCHWQCVRTTAAVATPVVYFQPYSLLTSPSELGINFYR